MSTSKAKLHKVLKQLETEPDEQLRIIDVNKSSLVDADVELLLDTIERTGAQPLQLWISKNHDLTDVTALRLARFLERNASVELIDASETGFGDVAARAFANVIAGQNRNETLQSLRIKHCALSDEGVGWLLEAAAKSQSMRGFDFAHNSKVVDMARLERREAFNNAINSARHSACARLFRAALFVFSALRTSRLGQAILLQHVAEVYFEAELKAAGLEHLRTMLDERARTRICTAAFVSAHARAARAKEFSETAFRNQSVLAAERGDLPAVKRLAKQVKDINAEATGVSHAVLKGWTALQRVAARGLLEVTQWLVREARADVDRADADVRQTPLSLACQQGEADVAQFLVEAGADLNATSVEGCTALYFCAERGQATAARVLIYSSHFITYNCLLIDVNLAANDGDTPLYVGAQRGSTAVLRLLLAAGADVDQAEEQGGRPWTVAVVAGHTASVRLLLGASASVNARGGLSCATIYFASVLGRVACVRLLLCYGRADMSLRGDAPEDRLARDVICFHPEANKANAPVIRAHFNTAERWEREREAAMRDGVVTRSRRRTLRPLRRIYGAMPEHLLSK